MIKWQIFTSKEAFIIGLTLIIVIGLVYIILPSSQHELINLISIASAAISLFGFLIAINQIQTLKEISEKNEVEIKEKLTNAYKIILLQDFITKTSVIQETERNIRDDNWQMCLKGLREILNLLDELTVLTNKYNLGIKRKNLNDIRSTHNQNITSIELKIKHSNYSIDSVSINNDLRSISSLLHITATQLKTELS